ncbi:MAG: hypothetical protein JJK50_14830 [Komagataeibacter rhaeticus]|nr:hypothetical protein [Komagataeibacter rhaeticus]
MEYASGDHGIRSLTGQIGNGRGRMGLQRHGMNRAFGQGERGFLGPVF